MTNTVDALMALADSYADAECSDYLTGEGSSLWYRENLLKALTEALAQPYVSLINEGNKAQPIIEPEFTGLPKRKLDDLLAQGYKINGVSFQREQDGATWRRGFITYGGMVGWWHGEDEQTQPVRGPLSNDQIQEIYISEYNMGHHGRDFENAFARAIERAHHIGGDK
jgi:hypothetical protein